MTSARLPLRDAPPEQAERLEEERAHVVGLQAPRPGLLHPQAQLFDVGLGEHLLVQGSFGDEPVEAGADLGVDDQPHRGRAQRLTVLRRRLASSPEARQPAGTAPGRRRARRHERPAGR